MKISRHHIAAGTTVLALGLLATVALASGGSSESATPAATQSAPEVRTDIVRQTVHRRAQSSSSPSPSPSASATTAAPVATPDDHGGRRGRGSDDDGFTQPTSSARTGDDHGGRGRGGDDDGVDDHGVDDGGHGRGRGRGRGGDD